MVNLICAALVAAAPVAEKSAMRTTADGATILRSLSAPLPGEDGERVGLVIAVAAQFDPSQVLVRLGAFGADPVGLSLRRDGARLYLSVARADAEHVAERARGIAGVTAVVPWQVPRSVNDDSIWVGQGYDTLARSTPIFARGITGSGEIVAVYDTGIDPDLCFFVYGFGAYTPAQTLIPPDIGVLDPTHKILANYVQPGAEAYDPAGSHGTAVAGCALGDDYLTPSTPLTAGHDFADGMAPNAKLVMMDGGSASGLSGIIGDQTASYLQSYLAGSRIQNHSWEATSTNLYGPFAEDLDRFVWAHEDMLFVNAHGNSGGAKDDGSQGDPAVAKNAMSVGATTNGRNLARDLAWFTSRGPTFDLRIKPDIVAPGDSVRTAQASGAVGDEGCATTQASGTSFAAPTAAGWTALARQYLREGWLPSGVPTPADATRPSAALLKAIMIASAEPLEGNDPFTMIQVDPPPSFNQGWGRPMLESALYFAGDARRTTTLDLWNHDGLIEGGFAELPILVAGTGEPFEVVVAWTDPPVPVAVAAALVNDLDLVVTDPVGTVYRGNVWSAGASLSGGAADVVNNVEAVRIVNPITGLWTARVEAVKPLGASGANGADRQGFALVATYDDCAGAVAAPTMPALTQTAAAISVTWGAVPGASRYFVYRAEGSSPAPGDFTLVSPGAIAATSYDDARVQCGRIYSYVVRAWNSCELGPASPARALLHDPGLCLTGPDFAGIRDARPLADAGCAKVRLEWDAATSNCACATGVVYSVWASPTLPIDPDTSVPIVSCVSATSLDVDVPPGSGLTYFLVRATDTFAGGSGLCAGVSDRNLEVLATLPMSPTVRTVLRDDFDASRLGWIRRTLFNPVNAWDFRDEVWAMSPSRALVAADQPWATDGAVEMAVPVIATADMLASFLHTYDTETSYDGGVVEYSIDGGANWLDAGPRIVAGRYSDWMWTGFGGRTLRQGFTGGTLGPMRESLVWLGDLAGQTVTLRFRMLTDSSGAHERWAIDDFRIIERDCTTPGVLTAAFTHDAPGCTGLAVLFDATSTYGGTALPYTFTWDFGDGSPLVGGAIVSHTYASAGVYDVVLTARDAPVLLTDSITMPVRIDEELTAPPLGNVLRIRRSATDVILSWTEPSGEWLGTDIVRGTARDRSDLAWYGRTPWGEARGFVWYRGLYTPPALHLFEVRLLSTCAGTPGP